MRLAHLHRGNTEILRGGIAVLHHIVKQADKLRIGVGQLSGSVGFGAVSQRTADLVPVGIIDLGGADGAQLRGIELVKNHRIASVVSQRKLVAADRLGLHVAVFVDVADLHRQVAHLARIALGRQIVLDRDLFLQQQRYAVKVDRSGIIRDRAVVCERRFGLCCKGRLLFGQILIDEVGRVVVPVRLRGRAVIQHIHQQRLELVRRCVSLELIHRIGLDAVLDRFSADVLAVLRPVHGRGDNAAHFHGRNAVKGINPAAVVLHTEGDLFLLRSGNVALFVIQILHAEQVGILDPLQILLRNVEVDGNIARKGQRRRRDAERAGSGRIRGILRCQQGVGQIQRGLGILRLAAQLRDRLRQIFEARQRDMCRAGVLKEQNLRSVRRSGINGIVHLRSGQRLLCDRRLVAAVGKALHRVDAKLARCAREALRAHAQHGVLLCGDGHGNRLLRCQMNLILRAVLQLIAQLRLAVLGNEQADLRGQNVVKVGTLIFRRCADGVQNADAVDQNVEGADIVGVKIRGIHRRANHGIHPVGQIVLHQRRALIQTVDLSALDGRRRLAVLLFAVINAVAGVDGAGIDRLFAILHAALIDLHVDHAAVGRAHADQLKAGAVEAELHGGIRRRERGVLDLGGHIDHPRRTGGEVKVIFVLAVLAVVVVRMGIGVLMLAVGIRVVIRVVSRDVVAILLCDLVPLAALAVRKGQEVVVRLLIVNHIRRLDDDLVNHTRAVGIADTIEHRGVGVVLGIDQVIRRDGDVSVRADLGKGHRSALGIGLFELARPNGRVDRICDFHRRRFRAEAAHIHRHLAVVVQDDRGLAVEADVVIRRGVILHRRGQRNAPQLGSGQLSVCVIDGNGVGSLVELAQVGRAALHAHHIGSAGQIAEFVAARGEILHGGRVLRADTLTEIGRDRLIISVGHSDIGIVRGSVRHCRQVCERNEILVCVLCRKVEIPQTSVRQLNGDALDRKGFVIRLKRVKAQAGQLFTELPFAVRGQLEHIFPHVLAQPQIIGQRNALVTRKAAVISAHIEQLRRPHAVGIARHHHAHTLDVVGHQVMIHDLFETEDRIIGGTAGGKCRAAGLSLAVKRNPHAVTRDVAGVGRVDRIALRIGHAQEALPSARHGEIKGARRAVGKVEHNGLDRNALIRPLHRVEAQTVDRTRPARAARKLKGVSLFVQADGIECDLPLLRKIRLIFGRIIERHILIQRFTAGDHAHGLEVAGRKPRVHRL